MILDKISTNIPESTTGSLCPAYHFRLSAESYQFYIQDDERDDDLLWTDLELRMNLVWIPRKFPSERFARDCSRRSSDPCGGVSIKFGAFGIT